MTNAKNRDRTLTAIRSEEELPLTGKPTHRYTAAGSQEGVEGMEQRLHAGSTSPGALLRLHDHSGLKELESFMDRQPLWESIALETSFARSIKGASLKGRRNFPGVALNMRLLMPADARFEIQGCLFAPGLLRDCILFNNKLASHLC